MREVPPERFESSPKSKREYSAYRDSHHSPWGSSIRPALMPSTSAICFAVTALTPRRPFSIASIRRRAVPPQSPPQFSLSHPAVLPVHSNHITRSNQADGFAVPITLQSIHRFIIIAAYLDLLPGHLRRTLERRLGHYHLVIRPRILHLFRFHINCMYDANLRKVGESVKNANGSMCRPSAVNAVSQRYKGLKKTKKSFFYVLFKRYILCLQPC